MYRTVLVLLRGTVPTHSTLSPSPSPLRQSVTSWLYVNEREPGTRREKIGAATSRSHRVDESGILGSRRVRLVIVSAKGELDR